MITCTRKLWFSAGHRVVGHESVCAHPHGHNYEVHITAQAAELDRIGRVVDFSVLKERYNSWVQSSWDHGFIFWKKDDLMTRMYLREEMQGFKHYMSSFNPTAEGLAGHLLSLGPELFPLTTAIQVQKVVIYETPNCWAEASL